MKKLILKTTLARVQVMAQTLRVHLGVMVLMGWVCPPASWATIYHLTDIGSLGAGVSYAQGMNSLGQVVGYSWVPTDLNNSHAFLYSNGSMQDLGRPFSGVTTAAAINAAGQVAATGDALVNSHGFIYQNGTVTDLLPFGINEASSINSNGQVVGRYTSSHAGLYSNGVAIDLGTLGGNTSVANAINDAGLVVGESRTAGVDIFGSYVTHAFLYKDGAMQDLGSLGGTYCSANAINSSGSTIAGSGWTVPYQPGGPNTEHAFSYTSGIIKDLGTLGGDKSGAYGVNSSDQIVGDAEVGGGVRHAFLYMGGTMLDLHSLVDNSATGWTLSAAVDINDSGWITGYGIAPNGRTRGFLLTPTPEPSFLGLIGAIVVLGRPIRRRGKKRSTVCCK